MKVYKIRWQALIHRLQDIPLALALHVESKGSETSAVLVRQFAGSLYDNDDRE